MNSWGAEVIWLTMQTVFLFILINFCACAKAELLVMPHTCFVNRFKGQRKTVQRQLRCARTSTALSMAQNSGQHLLWVFPSKILIIVEEIAAASTNVGVIAKPPLWAQQVLHRSLELVPSLITVINSQFWDWLVASGISEERDFYTFWTASPVSVSWVNTSTWCLPWSDRWEERTFVDEYAFWIHR